jgi:hypothetical protein
MQAQAGRQVKRDIKAFYAYMGKKNNPYMYGT